MCTVSWIHEDDGYQLFCNRDEQLTRRIAQPPRLFERDGVRYLAPVDGEASGTWILTNEFGISLCLVNGAAPIDPDQSYRSRGLLLPELASARSLSDIAERVWKQDLAPYAPFLLTALEPGLPATVIEWDEFEKKIVPGGDSYMPLVSSSFQPSAVENSRRKQLASLVADSCTVHPAALLLFHQSHLPARGPYSPCMHRDHAATVSFSWVTVTDSEASMYYADGAPCQSISGESKSLALRQEEAAACLAYC